MENINVELILHRLDEIVLKQDEFSRKQEEVTTKLNELGEELAKMKTIENAVDNIKDWKEKVQEVVSTSDLKELKEWKGKMEEQLSPTQLTKLLKEHDQLKTFKIQAMMIYVIIQALMGVAVFWDKMF
jgi:heterodisulfide reductase subunit C